MIDASWAPGQRGIVMQRNWSGSTPSHRYWNAVPTGMSIETPRSRTVVSSPVPFVVNNDGTLSRNVAEVFFASLEDAEKKGPLESQLFVLELGIGVGLFARYFLDAFRDLCQQHHKDYYERLYYIAADRSRQMLLDVCRHGVLADHPGRYLLRLVDAMQPGSEKGTFMFIAASSSSDKKMHVPFSSC